MQIQVALTVVFIELSCIKAFIAVRLLQLQHMAQESELAKKVSCTSYVKDMTWKLLWVKVEK